MNRLFEPTYRMYVYLKHGTKMLCKKYIIKLEINIFKFHSFFITLVLTAMTYHGRCGGGRGGGGGTRGGPISVKKKKNENFKQTHKN